MLFDFCSYSALVIIYLPLTDFAKTSPFNGNAPIAPFLHTVKAAVALES